MPVTKTSKRGSARAPGGPLDMTKEFGGVRVLYYQPGVIDEARNRNVGIVIVEKGKRRVIPGPPRKVHRKDLFAQYGDNHEYAGEGKFIDNGAVNARGTKVTGAHLVNPFLAEDGSYRTIVAAFKSTMNQSFLRGMEAHVHTSVEDGNHLVWKGRTSCDGAIAVSPWVTKSALMEIAFWNSALLEQLEKTKSHLPKVKEHLPPHAKFSDNLDVMRRARTAFNPATGETELKGGWTPYSMPLEQCNMAIDMCHLTDGFDSEGEETGDYYYRLAIGRKTPWVLYRGEWKGLDTTFPFVYLNEKILGRAMRLHKKKAKSAAA